MTCLGLLVRRMLNCATACLPQSSMFAHIAEAPVDPILGTALAYKADPNPKKVNLGIGAARDEDGKPIVVCARAIKRSGPNSQVARADA